MIDATAVAISNFFDKNTNFIQLLTLYKKTQIMTARKKKPKTVATQPKSSITTDVGGTPPNGDNSTVNITDKPKPVEIHEPVVTHTEPPVTTVEGKHTVEPVLPIEGAVSPVVEPKPVVTEPVEETPTVEPTPEPVKEVEHPAFDYDGKVKLSDQGFDYVDKKHALKVVKESHVYEKYKDDLTKQIKANKIEPNYVEMLRMIISADDKGQKYSGTLEG